MILGFKTEIKGKKTLFPEKIINSLWNKVRSPNDITTLTTYINNGRDRGWHEAGYMDLDPKHHTIREDPTDRWQVGNKIHFATGVRSKNYFRFAPIIKCTAIQTFEIICADDIYPSEHNNEVYLYEIFSERLQEHFYKCFKVKVDNRFLQLEEIVQLSKNDGFDNANDLFNWFKLKEFKGKIIHWTDLRY